MGNFRSNDRGRNDRPRGGFGGNRGGFDRGPRRPLEMHDAVCAKCNENCQVPFKPRDSKNVLCKDCFSKEGGGRSNSRDSRGPRRNFSNSSSGSTIDIKKLEAKVDKILELLESLIEEEEEEEDDEEEEAKEEKEETTEEESEDSE